MTRTPDHFACRCLPLLIANQAGWQILNSFPIRATWDGSDRLDGVTIEPLSERLPPAKSHFGSGILTWSLPYLFRTPRGYNLHVRGPANSPKDGAAPLEGTIETDWTVATFTMSWKLTRPGMPVVFEAEEPICTIAPHRRGELEAFQPRLKKLLQSPKLALSYERWSQSRAAFLKDLLRPGSAAQRRGWQRDYLNGTSPDGSREPEHQTKLNLQPFVEDHCSCDDSANKGRSSALRAIESLFRGRL
jgi:hypothetical protein